MADTNAEYRLILKREFEARQSRNSQFSLRAFARILKLDPGFLSKLMSGKLLLSLDRADDITIKLDLTREQRNNFILSAAEEQKCHALYLIDPNLTDCDPNQDELNRAEKSRSKRT